MLRIISDIHGKAALHTKLAKTTATTIQIGDCGFKYNYLDSQLKYGKDWVLGGNHDNYPELVKKPHYLGDYAEIIASTDDQKLVKIFAVRGAYSIDKHYRTVGVDWWEQEEIAWEHLDSVLGAYEAFQPSIVLSHDCPYSMCIKLHGLTAKETRTGRLLQEMLMASPPKYWFYGHHHLNHTATICGCELRCLLHHTYLDLPLTVKSICKVDFEHGTKVETQIK
jgi:hypothetical protein